MKSILAVACACLIPIVTAHELQAREDSMKANNIRFTHAQRKLLVQLERDAFKYFLENQLDNGLVLDRQHNFGPRKKHGTCSLSATGMGLIAISLASSPEHHVISRDDARQRVRLALETCFKLKHVQGMMPHFVDSRTLQPVGNDVISTIDSSWLVAGALWAANYLQDRELQDLAMKLYNRIDWQFWSVSDVKGGPPLIRHGMAADGQYLRGVWDRFNAETLFMYVLAAGASPDRALKRDSLLALRPFYGEVAGLRFPSADLGLFVFQYSAELLNLRKLPAPDNIDFTAVAKTAAEANYRACKNASTLRKSSNVQGSQLPKFGTYALFWGLSAGDGPGGKADEYKEYGPQCLMDGTAHITATLASLSAAPKRVLENLANAELVPGIRGRYGYSNVNLDASWIGRDVVGIDLGAAVFAIDNVMYGNRVRRGFESVPVVRKALAELNKRR